MLLTPPSKTVAVPRPLSLLWVGCLGCVLGVGLGSERVAMAQTIADEAATDPAGPDRDGATAPLATDPFALAAVQTLAPVGPSRSQPEFAPLVLSQRSDRSDNLPRSAVPRGEELEAGEERAAEAAGGQPLATPETGAIGESGAIGDSPMGGGAAIDPELGILRLQEQEPNLQPAKTLPSPQSYPRFSYGLRGQVSSVYSSNVLGSQTSFSDHITQEGLSFTVVPQISRRTAVIAQLVGSWSQYGEFYGLDYRQFSSQIRVRHSLTERVYGELGWQHQEYFEADGGDRFLKTNILQASLVHQKPLTSRLDLNNFYQSQLSLSDPSSRNQVVQRLGSGLSYELRPDLDFGLNYTLEVSAFTESDRLDFYNQALASLDWEFAPRQRLRMFTGFAFGESSVESIQFDGFLFGLGLETGLRF